MDTDNITHIEDMALRIILSRHRPRLHERMLLSATQRITEHMCNGEMDDALAEALACMRMEPRYFAVAAIVGNAMNRLEAN